MWLCCIFYYYGYTHPDYNTWTHLTWYSQDRVLQWLQALHANIYPGAAWSHVTSYQQEDQSVLPLTCKTIYETRGQGGPHAGNSQVAVPPTITTSTVPSPEFLRVTGQTISPAPIIAPLTAMSEMLSSATLDPLQEHQTSKTSVKKSKNATKGRKEKVKCLQSKNPLKVKFKFQHPIHSAVLFKHWPQRLKKGNRWPAILLFVSQLGPNAPHQTKTSPLLHC